MKKTITLLAFSILFIGAFAQTLPPYVPANGLVVWYPFDGNAGDSSGHGNNGTVSGATTASDRNGNSNRAYSFNGTTNYIYVAPITALSTNISKGISLSFWANAATSNTGEMIDLRSNDNSSLEATVYQAKFNVGNSNMPNSSQSFSITTDSITVNQWMHIVIVQDSARSKTTIYKNGSIDTVMNRTLPGFVSPKINLGSRFDFNNVRSSYWSGKLDDIGIWGRELTLGEISALYKSVNTGINNSNDVHTFSLYPNPATNELIINNRNQSMKGSLLVIHDMLGRKVLEQQISNEISEYSLSINELETGTYFLTILKGGEVSRLKFVKE